MYEKSISLFQDLCGKGVLMQSLWGGCWWWSLSVTQCTRAAVEVEPVPLAVKASVQVSSWRGSREVATFWQQFVPTFGSLKLIWVCVHILHSLCCAKIQTSGSLTWCEQIYLPTAVTGKYLFFAHLQFSWKLSLRQTGGCSTSSL